MKKMVHLRVINNPRLLMTLYISVFVLLVGVSVMFAKLSKQIVSKYDDISIVSTTKLSLLLKIRKNIDYDHFAVLTHILDNSKDSLLNDDQLIVRTRVINDQYFNQYKLIINQREELTLFNKLVEARQKNAICREELFKRYYLNGNSSSTIDYYYKNHKKSFEAYQNALSILSDYLINETEVKTSGVSLYISRHKLPLRTCIILIILLLLYLGYLIRNTLSKLKLQNNVLKENEINLSEQKNLLEALLAFSPDGIVGINENEKIIIFNNRAEKLFGYKKEEIMGEDLSKLIPAEVHAQHHQHVEKFMKRPENRQMGAAIIDLVGLRKDGNKFFIDISIGSLQTKDGKISLASVRDITKQKEILKREQQLAGMLTNSLFFAGIAKIDNSIIYLNNALCDALGIKKEDVRNYKISDFVYDGYLKPTEEFIQKIIEDGTGIGILENVIKDIDGNPLPILQVIMIHNNESGQPEYISTTAINIQELKQKEAKLKKQSSELRSLSRSLITAREEERKKIAKEIHDELGQNLTAIKFHAAWLSTNISGDEVGIENNLKQLTKIADEVVQTSRKIYNSLYPQMLDDVGLVGAINWHADTFLKPAHIDFELQSKIEDDFQPDNKNILLVLFRVYQECITNVIRYSKANSVIVELFIHKDNIVMLIEDDGIGFEVDLVDSKMHHGLLGMRERVHAENGKFTVQAAIGEGTKVRIIIPLNGG